MTRAHAILFLPPVLVLPQSRKMMMGGKEKSRLDERGRETKRDPREKNR
jgi:hypothetical protein